MEVYMYKKLATLNNVALLIWFFFDMTGLQLGNIILVQQAWKDDAIFFIIFALAFILFLTTKKMGKYFLTIWLSLWLIVQFTSHWYYTIFGVTEKKLTGYNEYFSQTYHIIPASNTVLIPDLYHILLHILILFSLFTTILYLLKQQKMRLGSRT